MIESLKIAAEAIVRGVAERAVEFYRQYPARSISYAVAAIVAVGGALGATVDATSVGSVLELVLPIVLGGEVIHRRVTPVA